MTEIRQRVPDSWSGAMLPGHPSGKVSRRRRGMAAVVAAAVAGLMVATPGVSVAGTLGGGLEVPVSADAMSPDGGISAGMLTTAGAAVPKLAWTSCDGEFQCATARVPLDYRHPDGAKISIALIRHVATDPTHRIGSLFVQTGGPTVQVDLFPGQIYPALPAALELRYDTITFDPRGFGHSTAVRCFGSQAEQDAFFSTVPPFPVGAAQQAAVIATYARFDALCVARAGSLLYHVTSADVARDLDLLRQAVGDPVLHYLGLSYATGIGAIYANLFPGRVGHMLLDGNLPPVTWSSDDQSRPEFVRDGSDRAAATVMNSFLTLCGQANTSSCAFSAGSPAATRAKWHTLLHRLLRHPVTIGSPAQTVTYADIIAATPPGALADWPQAAVTLQQVWTASSASTTAGAGASSTASRPPARPGNNPVLAKGASPTAAPGSGGLAPAYSGPDQTFAQVCADTSNPTNPGDYPALAARAAARTGPYGQLWTWQDEPCALWPASASQDRYRGPWNRPTANPILVFGNTGDPATNYQASVAMAHELADARLLTINEFGHTEHGNPNTCATRYEVSYMLTGALPPPGTTCPADSSPFPAS